MVEISVFADESGEVGLDESYAIPQANRVGCLTDSKKCSHPVLNLGHQPSHS